MLVAVQSLPEQVHIVRLRARKQAERLNLWQHRDMFDIYIYVFFVLYTFRLLWPAYRRGVQLLVHSCSILDPCTPRAPSKMVSDVFGQATSRLKHVHPHTF